METQLAVYKALIDAWEPVVVAMLDGRITTREAEAIKAALNVISDTTFAVKQSVRVGNLPPESRGPAGPTRTPGS